MSHDTIATMFTKVLGRFPRLLSYLLATRHFYRFKTARVICWDSNSFFSDQLSIFQINSLKSSEETDLGIKTFDLFIQNESRSCLNDSESWSITETNVGYFKWTG